MVPACYRVQRRCSAMTSGPYLDRQCYPLPRQAGLAWLGALTLDGESRIVSPQHEADRDALPIRQQCLYVAPQDCFFSQLGDALRPELPVEEGAVGQRI